MAWGGFLYTGWVKCKGKGTWSQRLGLVSSMVTMGSVPLDLEVLRFYRRFWVHTDIQQGRGQTASVKDNHSPCPHPQALRL